MKKFELYGEQAERLYVRESKTLEQIKEILHVSLTTLSDWSQKCEWPQKRAEQLKTPQIIEEKVKAKLYDKLAALAEIKSEEFTTADADAMSKLMAVLNKLDAQRDPLRAAVTVMGQLSKYLRHNHPNLVASVADILPGFFEHVRSENAR